MAKTAKKANSICVGHQKVKTVEQVDKIVEKSTTTFDFAGGCSAQRAGLVATCTQRVGFRTTRHRSGRQIAHPTQNCLRRLERKHQK